MHIAFVTPEFPSSGKFIGGLGNYILRLAQCLVERGHKVTVLQTSATQDATTTFEGIQIVKVKRSGRTLIGGVINLITFSQFRRAFSLFVDSYRAARAIRKLHNQQPISILQIPSILPLARFETTMLKDIPYCVRVSSYRPYWHRFMKTKSSIDSRIEERLESDQLRRTMFVYGPSYTLRDILRREEGLLDMEVIRPPFFLNTTEPDLSIYTQYLKNKDYVLFFGKADLHKGFPVLVEAMPTFFSRYPDAHLVFVGRKEPSRFSAGFPESTEQILKEYKERIILLPPLRHPQLFPIIQKARLVALPSLIDNLPNTCLEAMGLGKAVIGTVGASFDELIKERENGFLVPPGDAKALARKLNMSWDSPKLDQIGQAAKQFVENEFSPKKTVDHVLNYYQGVINEWSKKKHPSATDLDEDKSI